MLIVKKHIIDELARELPPLIPRIDVDKLTGGFLQPGTMRNYDMRGEGPLPRIKLGRKTAYPRAALIAWLQSKIEVVNKATEQETISDD